MHPITQVGSTDRETSMRAAAGAATRFAVTGARYSVRRPERSGHDLDACIMAVARDRDRNAFAALFAHFAPRVKTYLRKHGASADQAEDLTQETMLAVWRKAAWFDPAKAGAATWIFTIVRNLRIDALRQERYPAVLQEVAVPSQEPTDCDEPIVRAERERLIARALGHLPAEEAELVRLFFFEDNSHTEIERRLGLPLGTVKSRLRIVTRRLRKALGKDA